MLTESLESAASDVYDTDEEQHPEESVQCTSGSMALTWLCTMHMHYYM
jgi:hypothetical protein